MDDANRKMLHAGAEDGVKWGGEPIPQYLDICNETGIYREIDTMAYIKRCKAAVGKLDLKA
jgi:hypothetical protein